jgi:hypothetical protein
MTESNYHALFPVKRLGTKLHALPIGDCQRQQLLLDGYKGKKVLEAFKKSGNMCALSCFRHFSVNIIIEESGAQMRR